MKMVRYLLAVGILLVGHFVSWSQTNDTIPSFIKGKQGSGYPVADTLNPKKGDSILRNKSAKTHNPYKVDSVTRKKHDPRKATLYSTFCPGLGQIYNHKYWKLPLVYAAVGIPAYFYFDNKRWYQKCQFALSVILDTPLTAAKLAKVDPLLRPYVVNGNDNSVRTARNEYRKNQDYSVIFFLLFWGLQIVDATVDAHLMDFDVSTDLTIHLQESPNSTAAGGLSGVGGVNTPLGLSLAFDIHKPKFKHLFVP